MVMNNLSSIFASNAPVDLSQAEKWSMKALNVSSAANQDLRSTDHDCLATLVAVLYNLGSINEESGVPFPYITLV